MEVFFGEKQSDETVHFSSKNTLFYNPIDEELEIKRKLMENGRTRIFSRSTEVMRFYRQREIEKSK